MKPDSFLDPSAIKKQCDDAINDLQSQNQKIDTYKKTIDGFLREPYIKSGSYEVTRQLLEDRKLALEVERYANELDIVDWNTYKDIVGNEVLDGAVVTKKEKALERKAEVKSKIASLKVQRSAYIEAGFFTDAVDSQISDYEAELEELEAVIAECDRIIGLYDLIEARSALLFRMGSQMCALANRVNCEIDAAYNGTGNLDGIDESLRLRMVEVCSVKQMGEIISDQFGFDDRTSKTMIKLYQNIQLEYPSVSQRERDWRFVRSLSEMGGYKNKTISGLESYVWEYGAGEAYPLNEPDNMPLYFEKSYFCDTLHISESDYLYMRQMVRMQHQITSDQIRMGANAIENKYFERNQPGSDFEKYKQNMERGIGRELDEIEFLEIYTEISREMENKGDFAHMLYTISAGSITEEAHNVKNRAIIPARGMSWNSAEERFAIAGWLGDAVYTGDDGKTSFGMDDYIADLDADNIVHRMRDQGGFLNNFVAYYDSLEEGDANTLRTKEFLTNHSYDDINEMISKRTGMNKSHLNVDNSYEVSTSNKQKNPAYNDTLWFLDMLKSMGE